jgi:hypothetical protein
VNHVLYKKIFVLMCVKQRDHRGRDGNDECLGENQGGRFGHVSEKGRVRKENDDVIVCT